MVLTLLLQFVVPLLPEAAYQRLFQVLVQRFAFSAPLCHRAAADVPLVVVHSLEVAIVFDANRIKVAGYRLGIVYFAVTVGLLYRT